MRTCLSVRFACCSPPNKRASSRSSCIVSVFSVSGNCCPSIVASCCSIDVTSLTIALRACTSVARYESRPAQRVCMACIVARSRSFCSVSSAVSSQLTSCPASARSVSLY